MKLSEDLQAMIENKKKHIFGEEHPSMASMHDTLGELMFIQSIQRYKDETDLDGVIESLEKTVLSSPINSMDNVIVITNMLCQIAAMKLIKKDREHMKNVK